MTSEPTKTARRAGNISQWSIDHPYTVIAFYLGVVAVAVVAILFFMPRRMMPYVQSPIIGVVTMMPGLSAEEMELYISKPIEEQLVNVRNLHYIRSSAQDGISIVSLEFNYGTDMARALFDVQALMNVIQASLPAAGANLKPSWVLAIDPLNLPILSLSVTGEGWDPIRVREFVDNELTNRLKVISQVYSVVPFGGYKRQLQVIVDRNKLAAFGLSITDVKSAVDRFNVSRAAGNLTHGSRESIVRVDALARGPREVADLPITSALPPGVDGLGFAGPGAAAQPSPAASGMGGMGGGASQTSSTAMPAGGAGKSPTGFLDNPRLVYIKDVARVQDSFWEKRSGYFYGHDGKMESAIEAAVIQDPGASSSLVVPRVMKVINQLERENPGLKIQVAYDNAHFVNILFRNMFEELGLAILLTGLVVFLFLGDWRGTLISLITIPTSLAIAILALIPMGMTLNSGTLIGLLIGIGRLVDDSVIDIHAVHRQLKMGKDPARAAVDGITEVRLAVLASTFMLCLALTPLLFSGGVTQVMFRELVWPIIMALLASMLVSFTLTALLAARLLREEAPGARHNWLHRLVVAPSQRFLEAIETGYARALGSMLKRRFISLLPAMVTIIIGFGFYFFIGSEMMPLADVGQAYGIMEAAPGTSYPRTEEMAAAVTRMLLKHPEIEKVSTEVGQETMFESFSPFYTGYAMPAVNAATFMITLTDKDRRKKTIWQVLDDVQAEAIATIPGLRRVQFKEMGSDVMASSLAPIQLLVYGKDFAMIDRLGREVAGIAEKTPGMYQVATNWSMENPSFTIKVNPARAVELGLSADEVAGQAYYSLRGGLTDEFYRLPNLRQDTVLVRYQSDQRRDRADLKQMYITAPGGRVVPLSSLASITARKAPTTIERDGLRRVQTVTGYYRPGGTPSMDLSMTVLMEAMAKLNFPPGYGIEMRGDMTQMMDSFRRLLWGLLFALIFILLVLVAQFRGFLQPLQMVASLPLELSGVFIALFLAHMHFSTVSIMAVIVLTGMDITTAILLIDMIMAYRDRWVARDQAVVQAAPQRLRPILMTSIITIIVMFPVAFFPRTGMDAYSPLGMVIVGGLTAGTLLSLFVIPILHTLVDDLVKWLNQRLLKREWKWPVTRSADDWSP